MLIFLGMMILVCCTLFAKHLSNKEKKKKDMEQTQTTPYAPLMLFGEELLKQLIVNLNQKDGSSPSSSQSHSQSQIK